MIIRLTPKNRIQEEGSTILVWCYNMLDQQASLQVQTLLR